MGKFVRRWAAIALMLLALPLALSGVAGAQYREFSGRIDKVTSKQLIVDNRMGDKVKFAPADDVQVEGDKDEWDRLKKGDWVSVSWKMMDKPRKAYIVKVLPPKEEEGEVVD